MGKIKRTIKEQEFIKAYIDCKGNAGKAYLQVFPHVKKSSANVLGCNLLKKVSIPISEMLDLIGVDDNALSEKLREGLNATKQTGTGKDKKDVPHHYIRARYLEMALKVKAKFPVDQSRLELTGRDGDPLSIVLKEIVYNKEGKPTKEPVKKQDKKPETVEDTPF